MPDRLIEQVEEAMSTAIEDLVKLRDAAQRRDWEGCHAAVDNLLSRVPVSTMLRIAREEVQRRLPVFERHHPHIHWPRIWLEAIATEVPFTFDESNPEVLEEAPGPGGNSFAEAVRQLALALAAEGTRRITHAREAISEAINAEGTEIGASECQDLWDLWFQDALSLEEHKCYWVLQKLSSDPKAIAAELAAWNQLADELAAALGTTG